MSRFQCWCGHSKDEHVDQSCMACLKWRHRLDPKHRYQPIADLPTPPVKQARGPWALPSALRWR